MKRDLLLSMITSFGLIVSMVHGSTSLSRLRMHVGFAPTVSFVGGFRDRSYVLGASYSIEKNGLRLGLDLIGTGWTSNYLYKFEEHLLFDNQEVGETDDLKRHYLIGFAPNASWILHDRSSLWYRTAFIAGIIFGWPESPNEVWFDYMGKPMDKTILSPYIRFQRPFTAKIPFVGMAQFTYVPGAGLISSLLVGVDMNLIFWK